MKLRALALYACALLGFSSLQGFSVDAQASTQSAQTILTCTDLVTHSQSALKASQKSCPAYQAMGIWHAVQSDSSRAKDPKFASLRICSSKNPAYTYLFIRDKCPSYQVSTDYFRTINAPAIPIIETVTPVDYNSIQLTLAATPSTDSPIDYYLIRNLTSGISTKAIPNNSRQISVTGLSPSTSYAFSITAVNLDGLSQTPAKSRTVSTQAVSSSAPAPTVPAGSSDATLSAISLSTGTLSPTFSSAVTSYSLTVPNGTTSVTESATVNESHATFTVNGVSTSPGVPSSAISLSVGANTVTTVVAAQNGATKTYTLTITRTGTNDTTISSFSFAGLSPAVTATVNNTAHTVTAYVPSGTSRSALVASFSIGIGATMSIGSTSQTSGTTVNDFSSTLTYKVTAQDGVSTQNYAVTVTVVGPLPTISALSVNNGSRTGGTTVVITGTHFQSGARVFFGDTEAATTTFSSSTSISVTTPAHAQGISGVTVTNPDSGSIASSNAFTFNYNIGDIGPGGGIIFYYSSAGFAELGAQCGSHCHYLETAPSGWNNSAHSYAPASDPYVNWSNANYEYGHEGTAIGTGFANTATMSPSHSSTTQAAVLAYAGNDSSSNQWFIPSYDETNELCKFARGQATGNSAVACDTAAGTLKTETSTVYGGYQSNYYWTSTDSAANAYIWSFTAADIRLYGKQAAYFTVRPIRAVSGFSAPSFTLSARSEIRTVNTSATGFTINSEGQPITGFSISPTPPTGMSFNTTTGALSGTPTVTIPTTVFTITGTNTYGSTSETFTFEVNSCALGGLCQVGDTAPDGGIVFYANPYGFAEPGALCGSHCQYLEAAPADIFNGTWSSDTSNTSGATGTSIGSGFANTTTMITAAGSYLGDTSQAGYQARHYGGPNNNEAGQWFLPSSGEMTELVNNRTYVGGFTSIFYWTSTETGPTMAIFQQFIAGTAQASDAKYDGQEGVRPVRAFASTTPCATGGLCSLGATGPGGGTVYYVSSIGFNCGPTNAATCHYLEVAPSTWAGGVDPVKPLVGGPQNDAVATPNLTSYADVTALLTGESVGYGYKNTVQYAAYANDNTIGAGRVQSYQGGSKTDWYVPDLAELNLLCQWSGGITQSLTTVCSSPTTNLANLANNFYWSSSQWSNGSSYGAYIQNPQTGGSQVDQVHDTVSCKLRPIRAF